MRDRYSVRVKTHSSGCHCGPSVCRVRRGCLPLSVVLRFCKPQSRCGALWPGSLCRSLSVHTFKFQPYFPFPAAGLSPQLASTWNSGQPVAAAAAREPPPVRSTVPRDGLCSQAASREARASTGGPARVLPRRTGGAVVWSPRYLSVFSIRLSGWRGRCASSRTPDAPQSVSTQSSPDRPGGVGPATGKSKLVGVDGDSSSDCNSGPDL